MKLSTTRFGLMEIPDSAVIHLPDGIMGFPDDRRFVLLDHDAEGTPFKWLQSADSEQLAFIVIDPRLIASEYRVEVEPPDATALGVQSNETLIPMAIVNVPQENPMEMTVNMRAPILVHEAKRSGRQVILTNETYSIAHRIFPEAAANNGG